MGKIHNVEKMTDNRFVNLYHVDATLRYPIMWHPGQMMYLH